MAMDVRIEFMSAAQIRVLAKAMLEMADIEDRERAEQDKEMAAWRESRLLARASGVIAGPTDEPAAEDKPAKKPKAAKAAAPAEAPTPDSSAGASTPASTATTASPSDVTLEMVRAKLAALSQAGKAATVKDLIAKYGVSKLTDVPKDKYAELLDLAEGIA